MELSKVAQGGASFQFGPKQDIQPKLEKNQSLLLNESRVLTKEEVKQAVNGLNDIMSASHSHLKFQYHEKLKEYYVSIVDENTKEVIKEIPPKKLLDMVAAMWEQIGLIVDKKI